MAFNNVRSLSGVTAGCVGLLISLSACGSDSTGPGNLDPNAALQSLQLGLGSVLVTSPVTISADVRSTELASLLDHVDVSIDGTTQTMFALALRESFPAGTCLEDMFTFPSIPPGIVECTPPGPELALFMWQSHSASAPPDRMIVIVTDAGTSDFNFGDTFYDGTPFPSIAMYMQGQNSLWMSLAGSLTSQVAATAQSCGFPLPPYAKAGTCSVANFAEQGSITFEEVSQTAIISSSGTTGKQLNVSIPSQVLHGLWLDITETQKAGTPWDYNRSLSGFGRQLNK
jgi:hypothetical protein